MGIVFDIVIVAILTICILIGYKRGLVKVAFNICAFVISLLITMILYTPVTNLIINNTNIDDNIEKVIIENTSEENGDINEKSGINTYIQNYAQDVVAEAGNAVAETISRNVVGIGVMIVLFIIVRVILIFLSALSNMIANLPIVKQFNEIGGVAYGILEGLVIVYVILAIIFFIASVNGGSTITEIIDTSYITKLFYNNNIILKILF